MMEYCYFGKFRLEDGTTWFWNGVAWSCTMGPIIDQPCSSGPVCVGGVW